MAEGGSSSSSAAAAAAAAAAEEEAEEEKRGRLRAKDAVRDFMPFIVQALAAAVFVWLLLPVTFHGFIGFCILCAWLLEVEKWGRKRQRSEIASEERRKLNTKQTFAEGETARWLNEGIKRLWPLSMQKFASQRFFGPMTPYFLDKFKPWIVKEAKMNVESLHLGSDPPVFNSVRAIERPPDGDHLAYEADMDFLAGSGMKAQMSVLTKAGVGATFQISNLHIQGKVRISVKFLPGWPVVERVRICFASTPQVTMSYKTWLLDGSLMPIFQNIVMKTLDNAMVQSIVQPNMLEVDVKALSKLLSPDSQSAPAASFPWPVESKPTLVVEILEASNLVVADRNGFSDPYVTVQLGRQKPQRTKVIKKTLNPKWKDERHQFSIESWGMPNLLTLRVRDSDRVRYRFSVELGILSVPLNDLYKDPRKQLDDDRKPYEFGKRYEFFQQLVNVKSGHLRYAITVYGTNTHPPQAAAPSDEPYTSGTLAFQTQTQTQTQTQEIKSAVDVVASDWVETSSMPRSKSDTNLSRTVRTPPKPRPKGKSKVPPGAGQDPPPPLEVVEERAPGGDETHDFITMPYGPPGAFSIFHPGWVTPRSGGEKVLMDEPEAKPLAASSSRRTLFRRGKRKKPSQECVLTETMSEQSGSVDYSGELRSLEAYQGTIRMDLIDDTVPPEEPPEMRIHRQVQHLSPIVSWKTGSSVQPAAPPISHPVLKDVTDEDETTTEHPLVDQTAPPPPAEAHAMIPEPSQPQRRQAKILSLPKIWYQNAKSLAKSKGKKSKKKGETRMENGDAAAACLDDVDPTESRTESFDARFGFSPLDHNGRSAEGDSAELRKIVHETRESRAAGSQSDRPNRAAKVKQWIKDQSKSFRLEPRPKLHTPLIGIPETQRRRNGKA